MPGPAADSTAYRNAAGELLRACRGLAERGLVPAAAGNASVAVEGAVLVTGSGAAFADLGADDLTLVDGAGTVLAGERPPTSELSLHLAAHRGPGVGAVVHTHGRHAVALSTVATVVPALHYYCVDLGGPVPVAAYHRYGTQALAEATIAAMAGRTAVVMANHGSVTVGANVAQAAARAELLEWLCQVALLARSAGTPQALTPEQLAAVAAPVPGDLS